MQSAVIVAGGRATRFGDADKAVVDLAGVPMIRRVADRLVGVVDELVVNCRDDQLDAIADALTGYRLPVTFALDDNPDRGPMAGIERGLSAVTGEYGFVVACDMPFVDPDVVALLFERARGHDAALPRTDAGWYQTMHAVYHATRMPAACRDALDREDLSVMAPLDTLDVAVIPETDVRAVGSLGSFENLNTREEFDAAADRFTR